MFEVDAFSAGEYLRHTGRIGHDEPVIARELAGGVSNIVLLISLPTRGEQFVLKQARGRLRVKDEWRCPLERIWREVETLQVCAALLQRSQPPTQDVRPVVPRLLWEDRPHYVYAMTAAPETHQTWKELLFAGPAGSQGQLAEACGRMLAAIHAGTWENAALASQFADRTYFEQLRLDPYYRQIARLHPDLSDPIQQLIQSVLDHRLALVHGDFSPKNLLVWPGRLMLIDYEVGHYGDPAFDLGFFLTHLVLKSVWSGERRREYLTILETFWASYSAAMSSPVAADERASLEQRAVQNLAGCMLARVDGKSPVDYLTADQQVVVRRTARQWLRDPPRDMATVVEEMLGMGD